MKPKFSPWFLVVRSYSTRDFIHGKKNTEKQNQLFSLLFILKNLFSNYISYFPCLGLMEYEQSHSKQYIHALKTVNCLKSDVNFLMSKLPSAACVDVHWLLNAATLSSASFIGLTINYLLPSSHEEENNEERDFFY